MAKSRRDFFKSFATPLKQTKEEAPLLVRPPYGEDESIFQNMCPSCETKACVASCDEKIIYITDDGTPSLDFSHSGCTFCEDCANACVDNVLSLANTHTADTINANFAISLETCVAHHGVICYSCKEPCIDDAILFIGLFNPIIDMQKCTSCGFCAPRCPTNAIEYSPKPIANISDSNETVNNKGYENESKG